MDYRADRHVQLSLGLQVWPGEFVVKMTEVGADRLVSDALVPAAVAALTPKVIEVAGPPVREEVQRFDFSEFQMLRRQARSRS